MKQAAVTFGDPLNFLLNWGQMPKNRAKVNCDKEDQVCKMSAKITNAHFVSEHVDDEAILTSLGVHAEWRR
jgi:hypothetical protein